MKKACNDKEPKIYRPGAVFFMIVGLIVIVKAPEAPNTSDMIWDALSGLVLFGGGIWLWNKKQDKT